MRPRVLRDLPDMSGLVAQAEAAKQARSREGLQDVLDMLERLEAFAPSEGDAIMCKQCGMPCYDEDNGYRRRAYPVAGDGVICEDCFLGGV